MRFACILSVEQYLLLVIFCDYFLDSFIVRTEPQQILNLCYQKILPLSNCHLYIPSHPRCAFLPRILGTVQWILTLCEVKERTEKDRHIVLLVLFCLGWPSPSLYFLFPPLSGWCNNVTNGNAAM